MYFSDIKIKINPTTYLVWLVLILSGRSTLLLCSLVCAVLHECSHVAAYLTYGAYVTQIEVLPFGFSANVGKTDKLTCAGECFCAFCGPVMNLFLSAVFLLMSEAYFGDCEYFIFCNLSLFIINMLPVIPPDGGRMLYFLLLKYKGVSLAVKVSKIISVLVTVIVLLIGVFILIESGYNAFVLVIGCYLLIYLLTSDSCF